jgi:hypothetical protein
LALAHADLTVAQGMERAEEWEVALLLAEFFQRPFRRFVHRFLGE